jgi:hypothetical protein
MTGTGYTAAGGQDPRGRDPRVLFVARDPGRFVPADGTIAFTGYAMAEEP